MTLSPFDRRLMEEGLGWFSRPRLASLLEMLGAGERDRLDVLVTMLRNAPVEEFDEALELFERAIVRAARQRDSADDRPEERRRRYSASAERREQRRRSG